MPKPRTRLASTLCLPVLLVSVSACDIVTADLRSQETAEWRRSYELQPGGRVEVVNVNGGIDVQRSSGRTVEVVVVKRVRAGSPEAAREALDRIEIAEEASPDTLKLETKLPRAAGLFQSGGGEVRYTLKVPASTSVRFRTVNGGIDLEDVDGTVWARTTNGGIKARAVGGPIDASTTNGGLDIEVTRIADPGVTLSCTNGGITLRLPRDARATISASVTNGGIDAQGLSLDTAETSRRRLEARLNGGGPAVRLSGTNGGIRIAGR